MSGNGFWSRVWRAIRGGDPPAPVINPPAPVINGPSMYDPPLGSQVLPVAADGGVFEFHLVPFFHWESDLLDQETLASRAASYVEPARGLLLRAVWNKVQTINPKEIVEAERTINDALKQGEDWCFGPLGEIVRCRARVRVLLDPRLRDSLLTFEQRRMELQAIHHQNMDHARYSGALAEEWLGIFRDLEDSGELTPAQRQLLVPFAASLTDAQFANTMHALAELRRTRAIDLVNVLQRIGTDHQNIGLFEFARAYDLAAADYAQQLGIDPLQWSLDQMSGQTSPGRR